MATSFFGSAFFGGEFFFGSSSAPATVVGGGVARGRKRWYRIGDRVYNVTPEQAEEIWDVFLARKEGQEIELPEAKSKPAPRITKAQKAEPITVEVPQFEYRPYDWRPMYQLLVRQQDLEAAQIMARAIQRRMQDEEDDIETILLALQHTWH